ncbi:MAG TPA: response regulator [Pyrinomonadaceae bacterium]|jgi:CheY-like chemotaxis protein
MPSARILIADDHEDNRELLRVMLQAAGYSVRATRDGRECVAAAVSEPFDLALIDLSMPALDGWHVLRALRADARTRALRCVAVTACAAEQDKHETLAAGFDGYLSKPYTAKELLTLVARLLDGHDAARPNERPANDPGAKVNDA